MRWAVEGLLATCAVIVLQVALPVLMRSSRLPKEIELPRRIQHACTGLLLLGLQPLFPDKIAVLLLGIATVLLYLFFQALRQSKELCDWFLARFSIYLRKHEISGDLPGAFFFLLGCFVAAFLFPMRIAKLSLLFLSIGDPCAGIATASFKQFQAPTNGKSIIGFFIMISIDLLIVFVSFSLVQEVPIPFYAYVGAVSAGEFVSD